MISCFMKSKLTLLSFVAAGMLAGGFCIFFVNEHILMRAVYALTALCAFVVIGQFCALKIAANENSRLQSILYNDMDAERFISEYGEVAQRIKPGKAEYMMAINNLSNAWAVKGEYEKAAEMLEELRPQELKYHKLGMIALTNNNLCGHYLFAGNAVKAEEKYRLLEALAEETKERMPAVSRNLNNNLRIHRQHLNLLRNEPVDIDYIEQEVELSANELRRANMRALLQMAKERNTEH